MKAALQRWLLARWYGGHAPGIMLPALAGFYGGLLRLRATLHRRGVLSSKKLSVPVIVIGNFTVGGTGKTPVVIAVVEHLVAKGWMPGVVSRGYGRSGTGALRVSADTSAKACGDEPLLIARRIGVPVQVDIDRVRAAAALIASGCNIIVADDGLQHLRLARDIEIEVRDGERGVGNGRLLPAGPLREPVRPVDLRIINGGSDGDGWSMQLTPAAARSLDGADPRALEKFCGQPIHAVAGIGNPLRFFNALRGQGLDVVEHPFPDHHTYSQQDLAKIPRPLLMTEKDAVKCTGFGLRDAWYVPVAAQLPTAFYDRLDARIAQLRNHVSP